MVDKKTHQVICTDFSNGKKHDFRLFKESKILIHPKVKAITDTGYQGIQKIHNNSELPKKKSKKNNMKEKNFDLDRYYTFIRYPFERVFSQDNKRLRYIGIAKNQFTEFMNAICFNLKRLTVLTM